jgi:DNA-binding NarL/FixJ family response regulator
MAKNSVSGVPASDNLASLRVPNTNHLRTPRWKVLRGEEMRQAILEELSEGYTVLQIALRLQVKRRTINYHMEVIREISGVRTASGMVGWAFRNGILK